MPTLKDIVYDTSVSCYGDIIIEKDNFVPFSEKVRNQVISSVKVDGFRPGKAPAAKAMQQIDPNQLIQTIMQETVKRFLPDSVKVVSDKIKEDGRYSLEFEASLADSSLGIQEDETFVFRLKVRLLPKNDISPLQKIKPPKVDISSVVPDRIGLDDFIKRESDKMLENLNGELKKIEKDEVKSLSEAFEQVEEAKNVFKTEDDFVNNLKNIYEYETEYLKSNARQREYIKLALEKVDDFDIPDTMIAPEATRITNNMVEDSEKSQISLADLFKNAGIPNYENVEITDKDSLLKVNTKYVYNEYKLMFILRTVYELHVDPKVTNKRIEEVAKDMQKNAAQYRVPSDLPVETYHNLAFDRLMRDAAIKQINVWATTNGESKTTKTKVEKADKKETSEK